MKKKEYVRPTIDVLSLYSADEEEDPEETNPTGF